MFSHHECVALLRSGGAIVDGSLPPWILLSCGVAPWLIGFGVIVWLLCRGRLCCRKQRERSEARPAASKGLMGDVKTPQPRDLRKEERQRQALRESARNLDWMA